MKTTKIEAGTCGVRLSTGGATYMGDGVYIICQPDERGVVQNVVLTGDDLRQLLAPEG